MFQGSLGIHPSWLMKDSTEKRLSCEASSVFAHGTLMEVEAPGPASHPSGATTGPIIASLNITLEKGPYALPNKALPLPVMVHPLNTNPLGSAADLRPCAVMNPWWT
ncbi:hypothetical protein IC575_012097 [Cucumis melo]